MIIDVAYLLGRIFGVISDPIVIGITFMLVWIFYLLIKRNFYLILVPTYLAILSKIYIEKYINDEYFFIHSTAYAYLIIAVVIYFLLRRFFNRGKNANN